MTVSPTRIVSSTFWLSSGVPGADRQPQHCVDSSDPVQCLKLLRELNVQVSSYHQLATALGTSSGDGQPLRGRLKRTRRRARQLASIVRRLILTLDGNESSGRLWCLLYCCLYVLALEMQRTLQLQRTFALHPAAGFINTGLVVHQLNKQQQQNKHHHHQPKETSGSLAGDDDDIPLADRLSLERAEINQLQQEIEELEYALQELRSNHNVVEIEGYLTGFKDGQEDHQLHLMAGDVVGQSMSINQTTTMCYYGGCGGGGGAIGHGDICSSSRMGGVMATSADGLEDADADDSLGLRSASPPPSPSSSSDDEDSSSLVKQRRCLCVVMGVVIVVFVLATVLGASLAFQQTQ